MTTEMVGSGWINRRWGDFLAKSWKWSSFWFADGYRFNLYKLGNGYQVATYQQADGICEYFDAFKVIQKIRGPF